MVPLRAGAGVVDGRRPEHGDRPGSVSEAGRARVEGLPADLAAKAAGVHATEAVIVGLVGAVARDGG